MEFNKLTGLSGSINSGKDLVGEMLCYISQAENPTYKGFDSEVVLECSYEIKKCADKLKDIVCIIIGCTRAQLEDEEFKNKELGPEWWVYINEEGYSNILYTQEQYNKLTKNQQSWMTLVKLTPRKILQLFGTQGGRMIVHPNIWVTSLFSEYRPINNIKTSNKFNDSRLNHGYNKTKIWRTYYNIKQRCYNYKHPRYNDYGGRGITMADIWRDSIESFIEWAKDNGYNENLTIDRKDNNKGYSPENCRCVSYSTQAINTKVRKDNKSGYKGVSKDKHNWRADIQINKKRKFLGYFNNPEEASEAYEEAFLERENLYEIQEEDKLIYPSWVVTDVRFPDNEGVAIKQRNGLLIGIKRKFALKQPSYAYLKAENEDEYQVPKALKEVNIELYNSLMHESETSMGDHSWCDVIIENNGTVEELFNNVLNAVKS